MKNCFILFCILFNCNCICMEQESVEIFKPSVLGRVYSDLSKAHLIGKWLSPLETKKADRIIKAYDFTNWNSQIQPFEFDLLFQVGIVLETLGYRERAAEMILFAYNKGYSDNFVIEALNGKKVNKKAVISALEGLGLQH